MTLVPPSIFDADGFARMRTPSLSFDPQQGHDVLLAQLLDACTTHGYLGISPQNLNLPVKLLRTIIVRNANIFETFVDPRIERSDGTRFCYEGCANISLLKNGEKFTPAVRTERPTEIELSYVEDDGVRTSIHLKETPPANCVESTLIAVLCHEIDHLDGRLITDIARERLGQTLVDCATAPDEASRLKAVKHMPFVLQFDGGQYVVRHGFEFFDSDVPFVSPDCIFLDLIFTSPDDLEDMRVKRDSKEYKIRASELILDSFS